MMPRDPSEHSKPDETKPGEVLPDHISGEEALRWEEALYGLDPDSEGATEGACEPEWFADLLDGRLDAEQRRLREDSLAEDPALHQDYAAYVRAVKSMRALGASEASDSGSPFLKARILASIQEEKAGRAGNHPGLTAPVRRRGVFVALLASSGVAAAALLGLLYVLQEGPQKSSEGREDSVSREYLPAKSRVLQDLEGPVAESSESVDPRQSLQIERLQGVAGVPDGGLASRGSQRGKAAASPGRKEMKIAGDWPAPSKMQNEDFALGRGRRAGPAQPRSGGPGYDSGSNKVAGRTREDRKESEVPEEEARELLAKDSRKRGRFKKSKSKSESKLLGGEGALGKVKKEREQMPRPQGPHEGPYGLDVLKVKPSSVPTAGGGGSVPVYDEVSLMLDYAKFTAGATSGVPGVGTVGQGPGEQGPGEQGPGGKRTRYRGPADQIVGGGGWDSDGKRPAMQGYASTLAVGNAGVLVLAVEMNPLQAASVQPRLNALEQERLYFSRAWPGAQPGVMGKGGGLPYETPPAPKAKQGASGQAKPVSVGAKAEGRQKAREARPPSGARSAASPTAAPTAAPIGGGEVPNDRLVYGRSGNKRSVSKPAHRVSLRDLYYPDELLSRSNFIDRNSDRVLVLKGTEEELRETLTLLFQHSKRHAIELIPTASLTPVAVEDVAKGPASNETRRSRGIYMPGSKAEKAKAPTENKIGAGLLDSQEENKEASAGDPMSTDKANSKLPPARKDAVPAAERDGAPARSARRSKGPDKRRYKQDLGEVAKKHEGEEPILEVRVMIRRARYPVPGVPGIPSSPTPGTPATPSPATPATPTPAIPGPSKKRK